MDMQSDLATLDDLLEPRESTASGFREDYVPLRNGKMIHVRALNRLEALHVQAADDLAERERRALVLGVVSPKLTDDTVKTWQRRSDASEIEPVANRIAQLSGLMPDADKESYKSPGIEP